MTERDRALSLLKEGYSISDALPLFDIGGDTRATRAWLYDLAQEIKNERRKDQAEQFRAYHMNGEG